MRRAKREKLETAFRDACVSLSPPDMCRVCGERVHLMIYRGTRFCSQLCELANR